MMCAHLRQGFPCCHPLPLPYVPAPIPRRKRIGARVALFPIRQRPSPDYRRVGFRITSFEACSTFTHVPARMVAEPPQSGSLTPECFRPYRCLHDPPWLLPTGATVVGRDSHPPEEGAFPRRTVAGQLFPAQIVPQQSFCVGLFLAQSPCSFNCLLGVGAFDFPHLLPPTGSTAGFALASTPSKERAKA